MAKTGARTRPRRARKTINLGLQGGGAHGAFTWGVLDRLLEDDRIAFEGVTGASAGAMNAVVLAQGLSEGSTAAARAALRAFWEEIGRAAWASPLRRSPVEHMTGAWSLDASPGYLFLDMISRVLSPYDLNPFDLNPLRDVLTAQVDFERVQRCSALKLFISATHVKTGRARVFDQSELTVDHVMASACLPFMFKAVQINGEAYWDGGYMGNPPLHPLFDHCASDDVVIVQINPFRRDAEPRSARDILSRLNEITFNASLIRELRSIDFVTQLLEDGRLEGTGYRTVLTHLIGDEPMLSGLGASSKLNAEPEFLTLLHAQGRAAADAWLAAHFDDLGVRSTFSIADVFAGETDALDGERVKRRARYEGAAPDADDD